MSPPIKSLTIVEADCDFCSLTYGVAPCTAAIGVTGTRKCMNTRRTCQDRAHFTNEPVTLRFAKPTAYFPQDVEAIKSIESVASDPGIISLGENLGQRASLTVTLKDQPHSDTGPGFDPYHASRAYDPYKQGTLFGKFRARQPYLQGRPLRWLDGILGQSLAEMDTRHFVIESFNGPTPDGRYTLTAKDVLKLADNDRAQAPFATGGKLSGSMTTSTNSITLTPTGIGATYPASGYVNIGGKESCAYSLSGDVMTLTRAQLGSVAIAHSAQDRVQLERRYVSADPADIIYDLLVNDAGVDAAYCDLAAWKAETAAHYRRLMTGTVAEPTGVNTLVSEIIQQAALAMWWEPLTQQIRLQVLRAIPTDSERFTPANTIAGSLTIKEQPEKRLSQVWVYFGQKNPLDGQDDPSNYSQCALPIETDAEADYGAAKIKKIFSRWIPSGGSSVASRLGAILLAQYKDPPRRFTFKVARHSGETPTLGEGCRLQAQALQDDTGAAADVPIQITRLRVEPGWYEVEAEEANFASIDEDDLDNRVISINADAYNVVLRTLHDEVYPTPVSGDVVDFIVESWVNIGGYGAFPLDTGFWPDGVTKNVTVRGRIQGQGGTGGIGANGVGDAGAANGAPGLTAFKVRVPINLADTTGRIWGGGGAGGGGPCRNPDDHQGGGGGGGAGMVPGGGAPPLGGAEGGQAGSLDAGGIGGRSNTSTSYFSGPSLQDGMRGGNGGGPGLAGGNGSGSSDLPPGLGGAAGNSIEGIAFVTTIGSPGDRRGPQV